MEVMSRERQNILFSSSDKEYISFTWNLFHSETVRIGHLPTIEKTHLWTIGAIDFDVSISYIRKYGFCWCSPDLKLFSLSCLTRIAF